ncbi:transposon Ty3-I Gag-Pol polyprotein [Trichonephila clavipes]|nr:transposon Ty3-I Gag-Pol polyprotein [Trichonephila clavipes]
MQANIIKTAHERGHFAVLRTQDLVSKDFYIPRLKDKVEKCIQNCVTCILTNRKRGKLTPFELLFDTKMKSCQDIEIVELLNDEITAQFQENNVILSVKMPKSKSTKFKIRITAGTIPYADKLININYMT